MAEGFSKKNSVRTDMSCFWVPWRLRERNRNIPNFSTACQRAWVERARLGIWMLAIIGCGAFVYSAGSSARIERDLRGEVSELKTTQDQLLSERKQVQESVGDLAAVQAQIALAR